MTEANILVVAGDPALTADLQARLRALNCVVAGVARSAAAAIEFAGSLSPNLVLLDAPQSCAIEAIAAAQQIRSQFKIPVILLSTPTDEAALCSLAEPFAYLVKPFENRELRAHVEAACQQHNAALEIGRLSRLYATLSRLNQSVVEVQTSEELFLRSCQTLVECGQFEAAWIARWDQNEDRLVPIAMAGDDAGNNIREAIDHCARLKQAIRQQVPCTGLGSEVSGSSCLRGKEQPGFGACAACAIRLHHRAWGALVVQSAEFGFVNDAETALLTQIATDISFALELFENDREGRRAREELHRSEERYRSLVRASAQIVWTAPAHGDQSGDAMPEWQNFTGQTAAEMAGRGWLNAIHPEDRESTFAVWSQTVARGEAAEFENRVRRHDGVYRNMLVRAVPVRDQAGHLVEWVAMDIDVTDKKRAEEERRRADDKLAGEKIYLEQEIRSILGADLIGRSTGLKTVLDKVAKVATTTASVLLLGETGTGKELIARAVHRMSLRRDQSFIKMNCAAIPSGLLESELFGHERGAFTGAVNRKLGRVELADAGTLFLDEVAEIPLDLQPKLLRVLQDQEFERLGSTQTQRVDFRLIAATNADLLQSVKSRRFRSDLYYRLHVFPIHVPALRERKEDIPLLVEFFVKKFAGKMNKPGIEIPASTMEALIAWSWPGNIRELENFIERSVILTRGGTLEAPLRELLVPVGDENNESDLESKTRAQILRALRETGGQLSGPSGAAARLGLPRTTLQSKLKKMGIDYRQFAF
jgi:PAS domain S-box-containing protein